MRRFIFHVFAVLQIEPRFSLRGSLQVASREMNCKEVKMKTQFVLTSSNWIKPSRESSDRQIIPNKYKHTLTWKKKFFGVIQSPVHEEV